MPTERTSSIRRTAAFLLSTIALPTCASVTTREPLGETAVTLKAEEWEGTWLTPEGEVAIVKVMDEPTGACELFWLEDTDPPELHRIPFFVRESRGWIFASAPEYPLEATPGDYVWARIRKEGEVITLWAPKVERFKELVDAGALPGQVDKGDVYLGALESGHYELIVSGEKGLAFDWESPAVFRRVKQ